tara:strand:+ start:417 stop:995 length:579 start_codon:yes stop_codon:yes gene_type:complete
MKKKTLVQFVLFFLIIIISISFFNIYLKKNDKELPKETVSKPLNTDIIKDIRYLSKDIDGNTYLIEADNGISDVENQNLIYLNKVSAKIKFDDGKEVLIFAEKAVYNNDNYDTEFKNNVKLVYEEHNLTCDDFDIKFSENYAKIYNNVIYTSFLTKMFSDQIVIDLVTRTSEISMYKDKEKVKINLKKNGSN